MPRPAEHSWVRIDAETLGHLIAAVKARGYEVIGPSFRDGSISYHSIAKLDSPGRPGAALFGYAVEPTPLKDFLRAAQQDGDPAGYAFLGLRGCELAEPEVQAFFRARRKKCVIISVHCTETADTCCCTVTGVGPRARKGFDLGLTEVEPGDFLVEVATRAGAELLEEIPYEDAPMEMLERSLSLTAAAAERIARRTRQKEKT